VSPLAKKSAAEKGVDIS